MSETQPTLEDLRQSALPAWLWDGSRGRLVWANQAGVQAFDSSSLFELIDRPFDRQEPGVVRLLELASLLERGTSELALLHFPSVGFAVPLSCRCWLHALADGRRGVLVVQEAEKPKLSEAPDHLAGAVLAHLPMPLLVLAATGDFLHGNKAAEQLVGSRNSLAALLGSEERTAKLLARLQASALVTTTEHVDGRDLKCVFTRNTDGSLTLIAEDVTERRALEHDILSRQIADLDAKVAAAPRPPQPVTAEIQPTPAEAFENLGKSITAAVAAKILPVVTPEPLVEKPVVVVAEASNGDVKPPRKIPFVPDAVRLSLERTGQAILVGRDGEGLFATQQAATLLRFEDHGLLMSQDKLWSALFEGSSGAALSLITGSGTTEAYDCTRAFVPWLNGRADQFILRKLSTDAAPQPKFLPKIEALEVAAPLPVVVEKKIAEQAVATTPVDVEAVSESAIAHDELRAILDVASDGIITLDQDGHILGFSAGAEAIFGLTLAEVMNRPLESLLSAESRKILRDYLAGLNGPGLARVFNDGREVVATTRQGDSLPLFLTVSRLNSSKSRAALCAVVRDITTWKRTEQELREAKEQAEAANRQKSDFLARISHELRTPLNAIMGFSDVMRLERFGELRNDKYRAYANDIHDSGAHLLALINDLLDLSKVEAGKLELDFTAESLADATEHAVKLLQEEARNARVLLRTAFPAKLPRVVADHRALRQIVLNLVSNAVKYTNAGGQVIVSASVEADGSMVLRVKDTGIGMSETQLQDALQPFTRVETADRTRQGTGLGLPLTKALTEANRASLRLTSAPSQGTTAEVIFPGTRVLAE
jgi:PAS domain S-box-containing protein